MVVVPLGLFPTASTIVRQMSVIVRKYFFGLVAFWNEVVAVFLAQREQFGLIFFGCLSLADVLAGVLELADRCSWLRALIVG